MADARRLLPLRRAQSPPDDFYTEVLGFEPRTDVPIGNGDRWLTVGAPGQDGVELLLEPATHPAVGPYQDAISADGIPLASFAVDNVHSEYEMRARARLREQTPLHTSGAATSPM